jgi:hypothetical protein
LEIPKGYEIDNISISNAESMTQGYNRAMYESDAKYKIYMHQDVLIINRRFIYDMLDVFNSDRNIGMMGVVGNRSIAYDGGPFSDDINRRVGEIYQDLIIKSGYTIYQKAEKPCEDVAVIDGLLMATQYDLPWREDLFEGWDFYDCSQSMEFIKAGYRVVVPYMDTPWCFHDNDFLNMENYEHWRQVFEKEYRDVYYKWTDEYKAVSDLRLRSNDLNLGVKTTVIIMMHNQSVHVRRCTESILKYCGMDGVELVVIDDNSDEMQSEWIKSQDYITYIRFREGKSTYASRINSVIKILGIHNDIMLLDSELWTECDFLSQLNCIIKDNKDIGTVAPLFPCGLYGYIYNLKQSHRLSSPIYDVVTSQQAALYIRWDLYEKAKGFNEHMLHPHHAIMDFQLKALKNGYRNVVLPDIVLNNDSNMNFTDGITGSDVVVFRKEWGVHYLNEGPNMFLENLINQIDTPIKSILEVGCASGHNLMGLKNSYPSASLYGLELNPHAVEIAKCFADVECGNIETDGIPFKDVRFDVIIFGDVLEHLRNPDETVRMCREHLSDNGRIVCSIPNVQHISVLLPLINGRFEYTDVGLLDRTHIHLFTGSEIYKMFENTGYTIETMKGNMIDITDEEAAAIDKLKSVFPKINELGMKIFQYIVCAKKRG